MGDDDEFVLVLPVTSAAYKDLDIEIERGGTFADHRFLLDEEGVYFPFWNRESKFEPRDPPFWDTQLLENTAAVARQMQERFALPGPITFGVMQGDRVGLDFRFALGAAYPRPAGGGGLAIPLLRERGLPVERLPPLIYAGELRGIDYAYKLVGRVQEFLLYVGLRDQKDHMVLFRAVRNGTPFERFQKMSQRLGEYLAALARAATDAYDSAKAWGVFWPEDFFERDLPPILADSILT